MPQEPRRHSNATDETPSPTEEFCPPPPSRRPSGSRALVPNTTQDFGLIPRGSIATASSPASENTQPSPVGAGPTSSNYVIPPRPKPGRKPATDEPASKRKAQNRESQRAFRARKAAKLNEMQAQVESVEFKHRDELNSKLDEIHKLKQRNQELEAELLREQEQHKKATLERDYWKQQGSDHMGQIRLLEHQLQQHQFPLNAFGARQPVFFQEPFPASHQNSPTRGSVSSFTSYHTPSGMPVGCGNCKADGECACIAEITNVSPTHPYMDPIPLVRQPVGGSVSPTKAHPPQHLGPNPTEPFSDREIDITQLWLNRRARAAQQVPRSSSQFLTDADEVATCGFCTDDTNCLCKDASLQFQDNTRIGQETNPPSAIGMRTNAKSSVVGPGSCPDCQANPDQKAWCQRVAQLRSSGNDFDPSPSSRNSSISSTLEAMEPRIPDASTPYMSKSSIGCSEAFKLFQGRHSMDPDKMDWISTLKPVPFARRDTLAQPPRRYSALELDTAGVIATLGNTMQPLQPRITDGENADIVREAQNYQRRTHTPGTSTGSPVPISSLMNTINTSPRKWS